MKERFLPIGTVVMLKGGKKPVMVTSFCIFPTGTEIKDNQEVAAEKKIFEYGGCPYPEGMIDSNLACAFNHDQIEKILFEGYTTEEHKELSKLLNGGYEIYKQKYENTLEEELKKDSEE